MSTVVIQLIKKCSTWPPFTAVIDANRFRNSDCSINTSMADLLPEHPSGAQCLELAVGKQAAVEHPVWSNPPDLSPGYWEASFQVQ